MRYSVINMKKAKHFFVFTLLAVAIFPSVTFATWYNPLTWSFWSIFKKSEPTPIVLQIENKEVESTSTPVIAATTEEKPAIIQPKKTTVKIVAPIVQSVSEPIPVQEVDNTQNLVSIKNNVTKILNSRDATIATLQTTRDGFENSNYKDEYQNVIEIYDDIIQNLSTEKLMSTDLINTIDGAPTTMSSADFDKIYNAYLELLAMANDTNTKKADTFSQLSNLVDLSNAIVKARIELETTNQVFAPYSNTKSMSSADIELQRTQLGTEADSYIKNLIDTQTKDQTARKDKIQNYLKAIIYSPIYRR